MCECQFVAVIEIINSNQIICTGSGTMYSQMTFDISCKKSILCVHNAASIQLRAVVRHGTGCKNTPTLSTVNCVSVRIPA